MSTLGSILAFHLALGPGGGVSDGNKYDDLKAKLGLKTGGAASSGAPSETSSSDPDRTPAGGFDLGLERNAQAMEETEEQLVQAADERAASVGGPDVVVRESSSMRTLKVGLLIVGLGLSAGAGWTVKGQSDDRFIQDKQRQDAQTVMERLSKYKVGNGDLLLPEAIETHAVTISAAAKKMEQVLKAEQVTDALLKSAKADLEALNKKCKDYIQMAPVLDAARILDKAVFNFDATKAILALQESVNNLYVASLMMAREDQILIEFESTYNPKTVTAKSSERAWRFAHVKDDQGRPKGFLLGVSLMKDKEGKPIWRQEPIKAPPGYKFKSKDEKFRWQLKVKYDNPNLVGGKAEDFVDSDIIGVKDIKDDLSKAMREQLGEHHKGYKIMLLRRLYDRVADLKKASESAPAVFKKTQEKLNALSGQ